MLFGEAKVILKDMNKLEKKFMTMNPKRRVTRARLIKKFAVLSNKFEALMERPGLTINV